MDMKGEYRIEAPRDRVWEALNDADVLKDCIPGCEAVEKKSPTEFAAKVTAAVGPVKARFTGNVTLSDLNPPESYTISGEGKGGAAGFAKGGAKVHLTDEGNGSTLLRYDVKANVGGKLAQLGGRLIDGTAKKMADEFFRCFANRVAGVEPMAGAAAAIPERPAAEPQRHQVDVERQVSFPPSQPSMHEAASAAVGGPGEGMKGISRAEGERPSETREERDAAHGPDARRPSPAEAGRSAAITGAPTSHAKGDRIRQPASRGLSPITWIAGLIIIVLLLILILA